MKAYDDQAADAYGRVVTHYSMAAHVEMPGAPIASIAPVPDLRRKNWPRAKQKNRAVRASRSKDRALLLVKRGPVTVNAARIGEPTMTDSSGDRARCSKAETRHCLLRR